MMSTNKIKCPNCGTSIDIDEILSHQAEEKYKKEFDAKNADFDAKVKIFEENRSKAQEE